VLRAEAVFVASVVVFALDSIACALSSRWCARAGAGGAGVGDVGLIVAVFSALGELFDKTELVRR
jgi:hypothetical protein